MKLNTPISAIDLARRFGARVIGDDTIKATGINEIHKVENGDITFSDVAKYFKKSLESAASVIILNEAAECPEGKVILVCERPFDVYEAIVSENRPFHPMSATIDSTAEVDPTAIIEPNVVIGAHVKIGAHCYIQANAVIREYSNIGNHVIIQSGAMIGTDAFYFKKQAGKNIKWTSGGRVIIEDNVYVGSNSTINKGVSGDTVIGEGTKIDCLVHIAHGVVIGKHCVIAAQVGISGKTIVGDNTTILGQAGIAPSLKIGDNVVIHPKAGIARDLESGKSFFGFYAQEKTRSWRELIALRRLPEFMNEVNRKLKE